MEPEAWLTRWQEGRIGFHRSEVNEHLKRFSHHMLAPQAPSVLVPLCGKSVDMHWLRAQGATVTGVEIAEQAAAAFYAEAGQQPDVTDRRWEADGVTIHVADFLSPSVQDIGPFHAAYDRAALIAVAPQARAAYVDRLLSLLRPAATLLCVTLDYDPAEMKGPPFSVPEAEFRTLFEPHGTLTRLLTQDILHEEKKFRDAGLTALNEVVWLVEVGADSAGRAGDQTKS